MSWPVNRVTRFLDRLSVGPDEIEGMVCPSCLCGECEPSCDRVEVLALVVDVFKYAGHRFACAAVQPMWHKGLCDCGWAEVEKRLLP